MCCPPENEAAVLARERERSLEAVTVLGFPWAAARQWMCFYRTQEPVQVLILKPTKYCCLREKWLASNRPQADHILIRHLLGVHQDLAKGSKKKLGKGLFSGPQIPGAWFRHGIIARACLSPGPDAVHDVTNTPSLKCACKASLWIAGERIPSAVRAPSLHFLPEVSARVSSLRLVCLGGMVKGVEERG